MQRTMFAIISLFAVIPSACADSNPLAAVISLLDELAAKVTADGEAEAKAFKDYLAWCDTAAANTKYEIETSTALEGKLAAKIVSLGSDIDVGTSKIEGLAAAIAESDGELKDATTIREKELAEFAVSQKELEDTVNTLDRAINILSREMSKNPAALAQVDSTSMTTMIQSLSVVIDAASFSAADSKTLLGFVQAQQESDDAEPGAPAAAVYKTHSTNIIDVLEDLKDKAETELSDVRKAESNTAHNYAMLKQSLDDQMAADNKAMKEEKSAKAAAEEDKAVAEGDHERTTAALKAAEAKLATVSSDCMTVAADHQATVASRDEELKTIAEARKILTDTTSGAVGQTYSFLQMSTSTDLAHSEIINIVKQLGRQYHSSALAQLASRLTAVVRFSAKDDVFAKVKGLISTMIAKLESESEADATEKAYCDEQLAKTELKRDELNEDISKLSTKIDQESARSAQLKGEVKELQAELADTAKQQAGMDKNRQESHADYVQAKADLEQGLSGVRGALSLLRDYYAAKDEAAMIQQPARPETFEKAEGAASSIVGILEVVESDFATNLAKEETDEADAERIYEKTTQENKVTTATKDQDVKYKTQEFKGLDKSLSELSSDRDTANTELSAVLEYYSKIKERCIAKPETYAARKDRRAAEIQGLKDALSILENDTALVQRKHRSYVRGSSLAL